MRRRCQRMICLVMSVMLLAACAGKEGEAENRDSFTDEELKEGEAEFQLDDNLYVDAKITTADKYESGLNSYYMEHYYENDVHQSKEEFFSDPTIFRKPVKEIRELLKETLGGQVSFDPDGKKTLGGEGFLWNYNEQFLRDGEKYELFSQWETGDEKMEKPDCLYGAVFEIAPLEEKNRNIKDGYYDILEVELKDPEEFAIVTIDRALWGENIGKYIEQITGRKVSEISEWIPVNDDTIKIVNEKFEEEGVPLRMQEEEPPFYKVCFHYEVDGLPLSSCVFFYRLKDGESASETAMLSSPESSGLDSLSELEQTAIVTEKGLERLEITSIRGPGKIYQKDQKVVSPDEVLRAVKKYYEKVLLTEPTTIRSMTLIYGGYFGKDDKGILVPIFSPMWRVQLWSDSEKRTEIYYDAFTGRQLS